VALKKWIAMGCCQLTLQLLTLVLGVAPQDIRNIPFLLYSAASNSSQDAIEVVRYITDLDPTAVTVKNTLLHLPIHYACSKGLLSTIEILYELYPQVIREIDSGGELPVHTLLLDNDSDVMKDEENSPKVNMLRFLLLRYPDEEVTISMKRATVTVTATMTMNSLKTPYIT
jgi:ankyrin repeat protein